MLKKIKQDIYENRIPIIIIIIYIIVTQTIFGMICPFRILTGISCPACGLTRASISLLKGDIPTAINYNPTVFVWWTFIILFFIDRYIHKFKFNVFPAGAIIVGVITLIWYANNIIQNSIFFYKIL